MILYSESGRATATAHLLQAVVAIPRLRTLAENLQAVPCEDSCTSVSFLRKVLADYTVLNYIFEIVQRAAYTDDSFMPVDEVAASVFGSVSKHNELPPLPRVKGELLGSACSS